MALKPAASSDPVHLLYETHQGWLHGWLRRRLGSNPDIADLVHDTFVNVIRAGQVPEIKEARPYLATVARRILANRNRRHQLEQAYLDALACLPEDLYPSPETHLLALESLQQIDHALDGLPSKPREAFLLVHVCGSSYQEAAQALKVSVSSIKQYMLRANRQVLFALA